MTFRKGLTPDWERLVAAKELLHITDNDQFSARSQQAVETLIANFSAPHEVREYTDSFSNDRIQIILALAVLVPKECRRILRRLIAAKKITHDELATMAHIPPRFSETILSEEFESFVTSMLDIFDPQ